MKIFSKFNVQKQTLKGKLFVYMMFLAIILLTSVLLGLSAIGKFTSVYDETRETLDFQLTVFEREIKNHFDELETTGIQLADELAKKTDNYLAENNISFDTLKGNNDCLLGLQKSVFDDLCIKLKQTSCSGIYVAFNTSVYMNNPDSLSGIYLQQNSIAPSDTDMLLYRGTPSLRSKTNIKMHRMWSLEFSKKNFVWFDNMINNKQSESYMRYNFSDICIIPKTSEKAMLFMIPIINEKGSVYGVCGFEIGETFFKSTHAQPSEFEHLIWLLTSNNDKCVNTENCLTCGTDKGYFHTLNGNLEEKHFEKNLNLYSNSDESYIGIRRNINVSNDKNKFNILVLMPKEDYDTYALSNTLNMILYLAILICFALLLCLIISRRFLSPILKSIEQIKQHEHIGENNSISEIDDLFKFLSEQDEEYEKTLSSLENEKSNYLDAYEKAQAEIDRLSYSRKKEIDPDDYQMFLDGIKTLTKAEKNIFDLYLSGKTAKEILEIADIKESTLKYHNHNILNKLGVSSRKQMLRYAALMNGEK